LNKRIAVTAGGGGHTGYAIAFAERFLQGRSDFIFIVDPEDLWSIWRIRKRLGPIDFVYSPRLRTFTERAYKALFRLPRTLSYNIKLPKVDLIISTGSNQSLIPSLISKLRGAKIYCIEAVDRIVTRSRTISILHDYLGATVLLHWPKQKNLYRRAILMGPLYPRPIYKPQEGDNIVIVTGSAGNPRLIKVLLKINIENVVLQIGRCCDIKVLKKLKPKWTIFRFNPDLERFIAKAKLVIAHQGLTAVEAKLGYKKDLVLAFNPDLPLTSSIDDAIELSKILKAELLLNYTVDELKRILKR
jgi:UDP-N-acetylglucosamine--N-acetylmuramyl-(pentapeptide) pyrophosphoryl-undecaprenol N-acetylglucosamine transferase